MTEITNSGSNTHEGRQRNYVLLAIYALTAIGITMYIAFSDIWPITYFQDLLLDSNNMYPVKAVFMLTLLSVGLALFPVYYVAKQMILRKNQGEVHAANFGTFDTDKRTYSFEYAAAVNTVSLGRESMEIKMGFAKRQFPLRQMKHFYLVSKSSYQTLYITFMDELGKVKKAAMNAEAGDSALAKLMAELSERFPDKSLNHLSQAEAFKQMKVTNPVVLAVIILGVILAIGAGVLVFALK